MWLICSSRPCRLLIRYVLPLVCVKTRENTNIKVYDVTTRRNTKTKWSSSVEMLTGACVCILPSPCIIPINNGVYVSLNDFLRWAGLFLSESTFVLNSSLFAATGYRATIMWVYAAHYLLNCCTDKDLTDSLIFHLVNCREWAYTDAGKSRVGSKGAVGAGKREQATGRAGRRAGDSSIELYIIVKRSVNALMSSVNNCFLVQLFTRNGKIHNYFLIPYIIVSICL